MPNDTAIVAALLILLLYGVAFAAAAAILAGTVWAVVRLVTKR